MDEIVAGQRIEDLSTPCFLVDIDKVKNNCSRMLNTCKKLGVGFRAHMKTAKSLEAGRLQTGDTKCRIVVSTLAEAEFFANNGFDDILYTNSPTQDKISRCQKLLVGLTKFHLMIDSEYSIDLLERNSVQNCRWSVFMKVDCGNLRAGVKWNSSRAVDIARRLTQSKFITFRGIYAHEGDSYSSTTPEDSRRKFDETANQLTELVQRLQSAQIECEYVSMGATPTCSHPGTALGLVNELHAGNYVFYDYEQVTIGSCQVADIACKVATRIIGNYPEKARLLIDSGFTALSHDGKTPAGVSVLFEGHAELKLFGMSQEIGKVCSAPGRDELNYSEYPEGTLLFIYPYHSCATAAMHPVYYVHQEGVVVDTWRPVRGW